MSIEQSSGIKGLMVWIPEDLHRKFRIKCMQENKTSKSVIIDFIRLYIEGENDGQNTGNSLEVKGKE